MRLMMDQKVVKLKQLEIAPSVVQEVTALIGGLRAEFRQGFIALAIFGSYACCETSEESDLDIFVIIEGLPDDEFLTGKFSRIREIIQKAGLDRKRQEKGFIWSWHDSPNRGWEITWEGFRLL